MIPKQRSIPTLNPGLISHKSRLWSVSGWPDKTAQSHHPRVQSQLALRLLAEASGVKRVGLAPVNPENS